MISSAKSTGAFPNIVFLLIGVAILVMTLLYRTKWGAMLFGVGENETAAYLSGINTRRLRGALSASLCAAPLSKEQLRG